MMPSIALKSCLEEVKRGRKTSVERPSVPGMIFAYGSSIGLEAAATCGAGASSAKSSVNSCITVRTFSLPRAISSSVRTTSSGCRSTGTETSEANSEEAVKAKAEATPPAVRTENRLFRKNIVWNPFVFLCALNFTMFRNRTVTADRNPRRIAAASGKAPRLIPDCKQNSYK